MELNYENYVIAWPSHRGKGHLFSLEVNNLVCPRGGRSGVSRIEGVYHESLRPERTCKVTCSKCRTKILRYDRSFFNRETGGETR